MAKQYTTNKISVPIELKADGSNVEKVLSGIQSQLIALQNIQGKSASGSRSQLIKDLQDAEKLMSALNKESSMGGGLSQRAFDNRLTQNQKSVAQINNLLKSSTKNINDFSSTFAGSFQKMEKPIRSAETAMDRFGRSLVNSLRYNLVNTFVDSVAQGMGDVKQHLEDVDKYLTNIQIVSGKTQSSLAETMREAQLYSKDLSTTTGEYLTAAETYYQQGLSGTEVQDRANATIRAAQISGQSVDAASQQITAVLNGFDIAGSEIENTLDKMAAVGAGTATSFQEISKAVQKVASSASEANIPLDDTLGMLATISSITREAPESVGTSLNTIISRFNALNAKEMEDGTSYTSKIEGAFQATGSGLTIFEENGLLKDRMKIITELAEKWDVLDDNQKAAVSSAVAGTRQYNRLAALLGNWDSFLEYRDISAESEGALERQSGIYQDSLEAIRQKTQATKEELVGSLFDVDVLKDANHWLTSLLETLNGAVKALGGFKGLGAVLGGPLAGGLSNTLVPYALGKLQNIAPSSLQEDKAIAEERNRQYQEATGRNVGFLSYGEVRSVSSQQEADAYVDKVNYLAELVEKQEELRQLEERYGVVREELNEQELQDLEKYKTGVHAVSDAVRVYENIYTAALQNRANALEQVKEGMKDGSFDASDATVRELTSQFDFEGQGGKDSLENELKSTTAMMSRLQSELDNYNKELNKIESQIDKAKTKTEEKILKGTRSKLRTNIRKTEADMTEVEKEILEQKKMIKEVEELMTSVDALGASLKTQKSPLVFAFQGQFDEIEKVFGGGKSAEKLRNSTKEMYDNMVRAYEDGSEEFIKNLREVTFKVGEEIHDATELFGKDGQKLAKEFAGDGSNIAQSNQFSQSIITAFTKSVQRDAMQAESLTSTLSSSDLQRQQVEQEMLNKKQQVERANATNVMIRSLVAAGTAFQAYQKQIDDTATSQEKFTSGSLAVVNALGAISSVALRGNPWLMAVQAGLTGLSILIPVVTGNTDLFASSLEKASKKAEKAKENFDKLTQSLNEQQALMPAAAKGYQELSAMDQENVIIYSELDEAMKSRYDQVAEYVETYAPELVKYYDSEGNAIIDLTKGYKDLAGSQENYLKLKAQENAQETYASMDSSTKHAASTLADVYGEASKKAIETKMVIEDTMKDVTIDDGTRRRNLETLNAQLADTKKIISETAKEWKDMVAMPSLGAVDGYYGLDKNTKDGLMMSSGFSSFTSTNEAMTEEMFIERTQKVTQAVISSSQELRDHLAEMEPEISAMMFDIARSLNMSSPGIEATFGMDKSDVLGGRFLVESIKFTREEVEREGAALSSEIERLNEEIYRLSQQEESATRDLAKERSAVGDGSSGGQELERLEREQSALQRKIQETESIFEDSIYRFDNLSDTSADAVANHMTRMQDATREYAATSVQAYRDVGEAFFDLQDNIAQYKDEGMSTEDLEFYEEQSQRMYAVLQGSNLEYFQEWKSNNLETMEYLQENHGIYADNYQTYNEFMSAVDEHKAKLKMMYEIGTAEGLEALQKEIFINKKKNMITELQAEGKHNEASLLLAADTADAQVWMDNQKKISMLENLRAELSAKGKSGDTSVEISATTYEALQDHSNVFSRQMDKLISKFKITGMAGGNVGVEMFKRTREDVINQLDSEIEKAMKDQASIMDKYSKSGKLGEASDALAYLSEFENQIAGLDYSGIDFKPIQLPDLPTIKKPTGNKIVPPGGSKGSKAKKSPKEKKEKEVADLILDLDPLKPYNDALKEIRHQTELLTKEREKLYGARYVESLEAEAKLNKQSLKIEESKLKKAKELAKEKQKSLGAGVKYDENGLITNYNEVLRVREAQANRLSGEAKDRAKKEVEDFKKQMDEYEKYALDTVREVEKSVQSLKSNLATLAREKIEYPVKIIIDAKDKDKDLIDFIADVNRHQKGEINFSVTSSQSANNLMNSLEAFRDISKQTGGAQGFINAMMGDANLANDPKKQLEMISEQEKKMQALGRELMEFSDQFREAFGAALQEATDIFSTELEKYSNVTLQYERMLEIVNLLGKNSTAEITSIYSHMENIYTKNLESSRSMAEMLRESRDEFKKGTDEWLIANDKYMDAQVKVLEQERALAEMLGQQYDGVVSSERKGLEEMLFGGMTLEEAKRNMADLREDREKYLDVEEKIYELNKMERSIKKDLKDLEFDPKAQNAVKKFLDAEMKHLQSKEKISENDLELSRKQYAIIKARIEMEKAREGEKMQLQLVRQDDGSYSHMYIRDTELAEEAQQKYQDSLDDLYKYSIKRTQELEDESLHIREKALTEYDRITSELKSGAIDEAEAVEQLEYAFDRMNDKLKENARQQAEMRRQAASAKLSQILGVSEADLYGVDSVEEGLSTIFDVLESGGELTDLSDVIEMLGLDSSNYIGSVGSQMEQIYNDLGGDSGAMSKLMEAFTETGHSTAAVIIGLLEETADISQLTEQILEDSLNGSGEKFDDFLEKISSGELDPEDIFTESIINGLDEVEATWENLSEIISADLDALVREFDITNPESSLGAAVDNILGAYDKYNEALENSYESLKNNQKELDSTTNELNKNMDKTLSKLKEEIKQVTEVTKKYASLRSEVLKAISEVTNYVKVLEKARKDIEEGNKPKTTGSGSSGGSSSGGKGSSSGSGSSNKPGQNLQNGKRVKIVQNSVYKEAYGKSSLRVYPDYLNSARKDLFIDAALNGRYRVSQKGGGYVGWFNPSALQAFHTGGKVGINKDEGLAILQENEAVITEKQAEIISQVRRSIDAIGAQGMSNISNVTENAGVHNYYIEFPNATDRNEIEEAIRGLSQGADQRSGE